MVYLLFFCTHYTVRGGNSSAGAGCGAFSGNFANYYNYGRWYLGAALLIIGTHYPSRGDASNAGARCGAICIINAVFTSNNWPYGAALSIKWYTLYCTWWSFSL